jgi:hypothetical protein
MQKIFLASLLVLAVVLDVAQAQFLKNKVVKATKPVDESCLAFIERGNNFTQAEVCQFYMCFEDRFPCGSEYWIINWGYKYCARYADSTFNDEFTQAGRELLAHVNTCLPRSLRRSYVRSNTINCKLLQLQAFKIQGKCYEREQELFCKGFPENSHLFTKVLDQSDFFNMDSVKMIKDTAEKCDPKIDLAKLMFKD